ncbi:MAG: diguanylate cyclase [Oscillatoriales cyanobacterium]|nr:MAG: diguanylate cyclase [Oscillatoriales cyanobacterium]
MSATCTLTAVGALGTTQVLIMPAEMRAQAVVQFLQNGDSTTGIKAIVLVDPSASPNPVVGVVNADQVARAAIAHSTFEQLPLQALATVPALVPAQTTVLRAGQICLGRSAQWVLWIDETDHITGIMARAALLELLAGELGLADNPGADRADRADRPDQASQSIHPSDSPKIQRDRPPTQETTIASPSSPTALFQGQPRRWVIDPYDGYWEWDLATDQLDLSPQWKALLGYLPTEISNSWVDWERLLLDESQPALAQFRQAARAGQVDRFQFLQRFQTKDHKMVHTLVRVLRERTDPDGNRLVGTITNISDLARDYDQLYYARQELIEILNSSVDGIAAIRAIRSESGQIIDFLWTTVNTMAASILQRSREELLDHRLLEQLPTVRQDGLFDAYVRVVETGQTFHRSLRVDRDGLEAWLQLTAVKLGDGLTLTFRDVTQAKQAEQILQETNQQLERRIDELKHRNREMALLSEMIDFLQVCVTVDEAYRAVADLVQALFPGCSGAVFALEPSSVALEAVAIWGTDSIGETLFYPDDCWALRRGRIHWAEHQHPGLLCRHAHALNGNAESLCLPMMAQSETLGLLYLCTPQANCLSGSKQQLARTVAEQVALAISNLRLRETLQQQSIRDPLTGLYNRRYLEEALEQAVCRARRDRSPIGAIMFDIDHFKQFNDTFGHDAGDLVLQEVAQFLQARIRGSDIACRYGGEEMTLILPGATLEEAVQRAEIMRLELKQLSLRHAGRLLGEITASFGVASFPQHAVTVATLLQAADGALYQAKWGGRDRVAVAKS